MLKRISEQLAAAAEAGQTRRTFLQVTALSGVGFMVGCSQETAEAPVAEETAAPPAETVTSTMNHFVRVASDNTVTVIIKHLDKGQGINTGLTTIVAEEMDADWGQMRWEFAPADAEKYANLMLGMQGTGGSSSTPNSWMQLRNAGAAAKAMLVDAAAAAWGVAAGEISVAKGVVSHEASGQSATFGELAEAAGAMTPPETPVLKDPKDFSLIGANVPRIDTPEKTDGTAVYAMDLDLPDMLVALVARSPKFGGVATSFEDSAALAVPGVKQVVQAGPSVAVIADGYWAASQGRDALEIEWDFSNAETRSSDDILAEFKAMADEPGFEIQTVGDAEGAFETAAQIVEAEYEFPYLAHAPMEPLDCVVQLKDGRCTVWSGSQIQTGDHFTAAAVAEVPPQNVEIKTLLAGGSFGRRAVTNSTNVAEAVLIAKTAGLDTPIKVIWSREDDIKGGYYRPTGVHKMKAGLDTDGNIIAWRNRIVVQPLMRGTSIEQMMPLGDVEFTITEGSEIPYAIENISVEAKEGRAGVPTLWWRSVGHTHTAYAVEAFLDEAAAAGGKDPIALRQELLKDHPRHLGVLNLAVEKAGPAPTGAGKGRGVAVHKSFNSYVAEIADITVNEDGTYKVDKVVCGVDCGTPINPDIIKAQVEGGLGYGLSAAMREEITLIDGEVQQSNFFDYFPLRISDMPDVEVHIVPSTEAPTGIGEPGTPPIAPAVANAIRAATGKTPQKMPFGDVLDV